LLDPLQKDIADALTAYAQAKGISLLIDLNRVPVIYAANNLDITKDFIAEYNRTHPAAAGAGHIRAAQAIERAFAEIGETTGERREVQHLDVLNYTNKVFRNLYSKAYIDLVNKMPEVPGWFYDKLDKPWKNERRRLALDKLNTRPLVKLLRQYQPDLIVCTHFLPAEIVSWLKAKERLSSRQAIVVTDFDVHAMWLVHH